MFINPRYPKPEREVYRSQHPYLENDVGAPYVCSYDMGDIRGLLACIDQAERATLPPMVPKELTHDAYLARVKTIFKDALPDV